MVEGQWDEINRLKKIKNIYLVGSPFSKIDLLFLKGLYVCIARHKRGGGGPSTDKRENKKAQPRDKITPWPQRT